MGILRKSNRVLGFYFACSKDMPDEFKEHYTYFLEKKYDPIKVKLCKKNKEYFFPPMSNLGGTELSFVCLEEDADTYKERGYNVQVVNSEYYNENFDINRFQCTEKQILNNIYRDYKKI